MNTPNIIRLTHPSGISLTLMDVGATWLSCEMGAPLLPMPREILLGSQTPDDYAKQTAYLGATIGRYANRIGAAQFILHGRPVLLRPNEGKNLLHGGDQGFHTKTWTIEASGKDFVVFSLFSEGGEAGFPGDLHTKVTYRLIDKGIVCEYEAVSDDVTPVSLTNHAYFNLDGANHKSDARHHSLAIASDFYLPVKKDAIPHGHLQSVSATSFDFRSEKTIAQNFLKGKDQKAVGGYDHAFLLRKECEDMKVPAAILTASDQSLSMSLFTDQPALQFYSGNHLKGIPARDGVYDAYQGIALETEHLPDSPNHPEWPQKSCFLVPNETYRTVTKLCFEVSS